MMGILPFLVQWVALGFFGMKTFAPSSPFGQQPYYPTGHSMPPKSHWTLLAEFQNLPEEEIETFLPQICNMVLDQESLNDPAIFDYLERIILGKCAQCLPFGMRVCGVLRAASAAPSEGLFKGMLTNTAQTQRKQDLLRTFTEKAEYYTAHGSQSLPAMVRDLRIEYFRDFNFLLDTLARLGIELKSFPVNQRNMHLKRALSQCNALLHYRMLSQRSISMMQTSFEDIYSYHDVSLEQIAHLCPAAACFSLHLPLQHSRDKTLRILRFVESECELLPSKDRCPYLVVVELLEQPFPCKSDELYTEGRRLEMTAEDIALGKDASYINPQIMPTMHAPPQTMPHALLEHVQEHKLGNTLESELQDNGILPHQNRNANKAIIDLDADENSDADAHNVPDDSSRKDSSGSSVSSSFISEQRGIVLDTTGGNQVFIRPADPNQQSHISTSVTSSSRSTGVASAGSFLDALRGGAGIHYDNDPQQFHPMPSPMRRARNHVHRRSSSLLRNRSPSGSTADSPKHASADTSTDSSADTSTSVNGADNSYVDAWTNRYSGLSSHPPSHPSAHLTKPPIHAYPSTSSGAAVYTTSSRSRPTYSQQHYQASAHMSSQFENHHQQEHQHHNHHRSQIRSQPHYQHHHHPADAINSSPTHGVDASSPSAYTGDEFLYPTRRGIVRPKTWEEKKAMVQSLSPFGRLPGWTLRSFIVKAGDDLRKEVLAQQLIEYCQRIFQQEGVDIYLRPYQIVNTGHQSGLVEFLEGAMSIDRIKKLKPDKSMTLPEYFNLHFGDSYSFIYAKAVQNFVRSLAGYSLITYLAQVRDRHNANLLIDSDGHLVHIDYGFIFGDSPGFNLNFESAPFKFTREYLDLLGGPDSQMFVLFEDLFVRGFQALQKHVEGLAAIVQLFYGDKRRAAADGLRSRLLFPTSQQDILSLVRDSFDNWRTKQYDWFQQQSNNIQM